MKKILSAAVLTAAMLIGTGIKAQIITNPVIMEVGGQQIRQSEFMKEFYNNVGQQLAAKPGVTFAEKQAALEEYVDLYAIFRAKLLDAHARGFDTVASLQNELARYRKELAAPYLIDSNVLRNLLAEAYERNHYSLHAAHILVPVAEDAAPADTLTAYNKALELRRRVTNGEDFFAVANDHFHSINPGVQPRANEGDLGYFTVFDMVYPFENAAYALKVGEVSQPVRTRYGYHIIKLIDRVEGLFGKLTMAHIWLHSTDSNNRRADIYMMYRQLNEGVAFEQLARQSDDRTTSDNGGVLSNAALSQLPPEYIHELVGMKEGEYSHPFFTQYGWHIIKLIKRDTLPRPENLEGFYKQRMTRDQRGDASRKTFAQESRAKYGIEDRTAMPMPQPKGRKRKGAVKMMATLDNLVAHVNDSVFSAQWKCKDSDYNNTDTLVVTPKQFYTELDVARYIGSHQRRSMPEGIKGYVQNQYEEFLDSVSIVYADSQLEKERPEFAEVVEEYRRGLMIFNYNDAMIWHKALSDTAGFIDFFNRESRTKRLDNPDDSLFFFHPRARVTIIDVADRNALDPEKAQKLITKAQKKEMGSSEMRNLLLKKINRKKFPSDDIVKVAVDQVEQTRQKLLGNDQWQKGVYLQDQTDGYRLLVVEEVLPRSLKGLVQARGYYLNAWQNEVERRLNDELRQKYNVKINKDVVRTITY